MVYGRYIGGLPLTNTVTIVEPKDPSGLVKGDTLLSTQYIAIECWTAAIEIRSQLSDSTAAILAKTPHVLHV